MRHAKAEDDSNVRTDAERHLTQRGAEDAARLGAHLAAHGLLPDLVLCSSAARTRETLQHLGATLPTILSEKLYLASAGDMLAQLQQTEDAAQHVMIIGHNPGMHELVVRLMADARSEDDIKRLTLKFPTCACARLTVDASSWAELSLGTATLESYIISKELADSKAA